MKLYLVRHGEATTEAEDARRPLSRNGRSEIEKLARHLARVAAIPDSFTIRHSGKLRAAQTAEILASYLRPAGPPEVATGLTPNDPPQEALDLIEDASTDLMLVGHLPHLAKLASLLIAGDPGRLALSLSGGGTVCMEVHAGNWTLNWMVVPALIAA